MMKTATFVQDVTWMCPVTKHFACSDGGYLVVTVLGQPIPPPGLINPVTGDLLQVIASHIPQGVDVFLADEHAVVLDADGDPANGLTPLESFAETMTHEEALAELGYELITE